MKDPITPLRLVIFGATGSIGRLLVEQALEQGHTVTAFVRTPAKLGLDHPRLHLVQGDVLNPAAVAQAVVGQEAVLIALGGGLTGKVRSEGTRNVIRAMAAAGVDRLICQTTLGAGGSRGNLNFYWKYLMFGLLLRSAYADHERQEAAIRASRLNWTIVRPAAFTDGPRAGHYHHGFAPTDRTLTLKIARADVADFMLRQLSTTAYLHQTPGLSY